MKRAVLAIAAIIALTTPAAASQEASQQSLQVRFLAGSDELTHMGEAQLDNFAREFKGQKGKRVVIRGHATLAESEGNSPDFAIGFSQRRSSNVRTYLAALGVAHSDMTTEAYGASRPLVGTAPADAANQRVELEITEGAGW